MNKEQATYYHTLAGIATSSSVQNRLGAGRSAAQAIQAFHPKAHWCPDWDGMFISELGAEWEACLCEIKRDLTQSQ